LHSESLSISIWNRLGYALATREIDRNLDLIRSGMAIADYLQMLFMMCVDALPNGMAIGTWADLPKKRKCMALCIRWETPG
jgi:hypothetical protein